MRRLRICYSHFAAHDGKAFDLLEDRLTGQAKSSKENGRIAQNVDKCYKAWANVTKQGQMLQNMDKCYKTRTNVTKCGQMLQNMNKGYKM